MASPLTSQQILGLLADHPRRLSALTDDLPAEQLRTRPAPDSWSANDVLAHLRSCADVWGDGIRIMLLEDNPTIRAINPRTWISSTVYPGLVFSPSLRAFLDQRAELLAALERLTPEGWSRTATVTGAGRPLHKTVLSYAERLATHERSHVTQVQRIVAARH